MSESVFFVEKVCCRQRLYIYIHIYVKSLVVGDEKVFQVGWGAVESCRVAGSIVFSYEYPGGASGVCHASLQ